MGDRLGTRGAVGILLLYSLFFIFSFGSIAEIQRKCVFFCTNVQELCACSYNFATFTSFNLADLKKKSAELRDNDGPRL